MMILYGNFLSFLDYVRRLDNTHMYLGALLHTRQVGLGSAGYENNWNVAKSHDIQFGTVYPWQLLIQAPVAKVAASVQGSTEEPMSWLVGMLESWCVWWGGRWGANCNIMHVYVFIYQFLSINKLPYNKSDGAVSVSGLKNFTTAHV